MSSKREEEIVSRLGVRDDPTALQEVRAILGEWFKDGKIEVALGSIDSVRPKLKY